MKTKIKLSVGSVIWLVLALLSLITSIYLMLRFRAAVPELQDMVEVAGAQVLPQNEGKLVSVQGRITIEGAAPADELFALDASSPVLVRTVQMYQWRESQETVETRRNGETVEETTYDYEAVWSESLINSRHFYDLAPHRNPEEMSLPSAVFYADTRLGDFSLSPEQMKMLESIAELPITDLNQSFADQYGLTVSGYYYTTVTDAKPVVGDVRIFFRMIDPARLQNVTVFARQSGHTFANYRCASGENVNDLLYRAVSKEEFLDAFAAESRTALIFCWCWTGFCLLIGAVLLFLHNR